MKHLSYALAALLIVSGCSAGVYHDRYGSAVVVEPVDLWGTVTFVDPAVHRIDLDYDDAGVHRSRSIYYDERGTRWNGVRYSEIHSGDVIAVRGHRDHDRWMAESVERHH